MTTYRAHRCRRRHKLYRAMARCIWKRAWIITGEGPFVMRCCGPNPDLWLFETEVSAVYAGKLFDRCRCGPYCKPPHQIAQLVLP